MRALRRAFLARKGLFTSMFNTLMPAYPSRTGTELPVVRARCGTGTICGERKGCMHPVTRRNFMRIGAGSVAAGAAAKITLLEPTALWSARAVAASDRVRFAAIG